MSVTVTSSHTYVFCTVRKALRYKVRILHLTASTTASSYTSGHRGAPHFSTPACSHTPTIMYIPQHYPSARLTNLTIARIQLLSLSTLICRSGYTSLITSPYSSHSSTSSSEKESLHNIKPRTSFSCLKRSIPQCVPLLKDRQHITAFPMLSQSAMILQRTELAI